MAKAYEKMSAAFGVAAKATAPIAVGAVGGLAGGVGLRWLAARYTPDMYRAKWAPLALGIGGAVVGAGVLSIPFVDYRTKSGRERAYKATLPLITIGAAASMVVLSFGPRFWLWFRTEYPNVAGAMTGGGQRALPPPPGNGNGALTNGGAQTGFTATTEQTAATQYTAVADPVVYSRAIAYDGGGFTSFKSGGLSPQQWGKLNKRAAGLIAGSGTSNLSSGVRGSRWAT
jgi:hypothetical protein